MYATIGIHPHEARLADDAAYQTMEQLARHPKVIAWGEIGLDYHYDHSPRETQKQVFTRQMELAAVSEVADRDSLPAIGRQRQRMGGLPRDDSGSVGSAGYRRHSALLYRERSAGKTRARHGLHDFVRRKSDLSQGAADSRCGARSSSRPHADRDRLRLIWRRFRTGANATNRPSSRKPPANSANCADSRRTQIGRADFQQFLQFFQID